MLKRIEIRTATRILLLFITLMAIAFSLMHGLFGYFLFLVPLIIYQLWEFFRFQISIQKEIDQFVESIHYRDFSRHFDVKNAPLELQPLREGFNQITSTFKDISKEKETSSQYLYKILDLVDTGIMSYTVENGDVIWMNDSLKKMLQLPYLKTIHSLQKRDEELYHEVTTLKPTESKIATIQLENRSFKVLLSATAFQTDGRKFMLIAFQNINEALDETESKAWQKLLSVMTHEIMNSVAPISSLADTLKNRLETFSAHIEDANRDGEMRDVKIGVETIKRRSESLLKFAETYRNLNKISKPNLSKVYVRDLFETLYQLMQPTLEQKNIEMEIVLPDTSLQLEIDASLIEQVLINLIINAKEALKDKDNGRIILSASLSNRQKVLIKVSDNGSGIPKDILESIFIPFFSTKKTGSGIGLSLCKQIMRLHKGNIRVYSVPGEGSVFTLQFN
jgi:signal transduction histidine kinase